MQIGKMRREKNARIGERGGGGGGGVGSLVKEYPCGIIEVIKDTKLDDCTDKGARKAESDEFFVGNVYTAPGSKSTVTMYRRSLER